MIVYLQRHGLATHLVEDYDKIVSRKLFISTTRSWENAKLTNLGKDQVLDKLKQCETKFDTIIHSPFLRTKQTAELMNKDNLKMYSNDSLVEILSEPPKLLSWLKIKIRLWIMICVFQSIFSLKVIDYIKEAKKILSKYESKFDNILIVSHQARIITILLFCWFSPKWTILKIDTKPAGISILKSK